MIRLRGLNKSYGSNDVLCGVDMDAEAGEFLVVLGQSGAGKSTLLRCMNRLAQADTGEMSVAGIDAMSAQDTRALRRQVAMIFQHHDVVPRLSVLRNVLTGRLGAVPVWSSILQLFSRADIALAKECLERVGLAHKAQARTDSLSGGQRQRVGIARALAQRPRIILADEPVASLDPKTARLVMRYLHDASRELGITVVCNLHQVDYAREFADRIVGLAHGRVVYNGAPDLMTEDGLARIYPGPEPGQGGAHSQEASEAAASFLNEPLTIATKGA
ncbi:phosphonate ABC transporter ATP-binding protein [Alcaligenes faecalis]|jgi:phosphonate transport system ATP-binding protein|uniref:Phosphonate ABC transporter ATP-binding protein n=1 Tax=Alcaligenes faecalis TaxID=511 RepID=A0ABY7N0G7_ALCFA|nr:phosphonate ABC transporter ATP-binding protein [Alcaligenes faecalis]WBM37556.1 phosphonate ABC transporter ATP-binding protein [Alcaligenes faecalis]